MSLDTNIPRSLEEIKLYQKHPGQPYLVQKTLFANVIQYHCTRNWLRNGNKPRGSHLSHLQALQAARKDFSPDARCVLTVHMLGLSTRCSSSSRRASLCWEEKRKQRKPVCPEKRVKSVHEQRGKTKKSAYVTCKLLERGGGGGGGTTVSCFV